MRARKLPSEFFNNLLVDRNDMARKPSAKPEVKRPDREKSQRERFIGTAREIGVDETGEEFMRALKKAVPPRRPPKHSSSS
jgi:hypothetical protein